jgi:hypothetical protein
MILAYIDMALGSMLLQAMAGVVFAAIVMGRRVLTAPLAWFYGKSADQDSNSDSQEMPTLSGDA